MFKRYFHCSLSAEETANDKLAKLRPIINVCTENFKRYIALCQELSSDDLLWLEVGMAAIHAEETGEVGYKMCCLCGYCLGFSVSTPTTGVIAGNLDVGYDVVMELLRHHLLRHHHLNDYSTTVHLAAEETTELFIKFFHSFPWLWNVGTSSYHQRYLRNAECARLRPPSSMQNFEVEKIPFITHKNIKPLPNIYTEIV